jgi:hypothetical protein
VKGTRHSEEQIITILKQGEAGLATAELCRQHGISEQTYYRWKAKYGGLDSGGARKFLTRPGPQGQFGPTNSGQVDFWISILGGGVVPNDHPLSSWTVVEKFPKVLFDFHGAGSG